MEDWYYGKRPTSVLTIASNQRHWPRRYTFNARNERHGSGVLCLDSAPAPARSHHRHSEQVGLILLRVWLLVIGNLLLLYLHLSSFFFWFPFNFSLLKRLTASHLITSLLFWNVYHDPGARKLSFLWQRFPRSPRPSTTSISSSRTTSRSSTMSCLSSSRLKWGLSIFTRSWTLRLIWSTPSTQTSRCVE